MPNNKINFDEINARVAIGLAMVFQQHGLSENDYINYVQQMVAHNQQTLGAPLLYSPNASQLPAPSAPNTP